MTTLFDNVVLAHDGTDEATLNLSNSSGVALVLKTDGRVELVASYSLDGTTFTDPALIEDHPDVGAPANEYFIMSTLGCVAVKFTVINEGDDAVTVSLQANAF